MASRLEAERAARIASNKRRLEDLGVVEAQAALDAGSPEKKPKKQRKAAGGAKSKPAAAEEQEPRRSGRQRRDVTYTEPSLQELQARAPAAAPEREPLPEYSPPAEAPVAQVQPSYDASEGRRDARGRLVFPGFPEFSPNLTPRQVIRAGSFGGIYFNPTGGKPGIKGRSVAVSPADHPSSWFEGLEKKAYVGKIYTVGRNKYGVKAGQDQAFWEEKGWIHEQDPRGWFQWYCRFYEGRRTEDDARQISRWKGVVGDKGRWVRALVNKVIRAGKRWDDASVSPVIRQTLAHWAFELTEDEFERMRGVVG